MSCWDYRWWQPDSRQLAWIRCLRGSDEYIVASLCQFPDSMGAYESAPGMTGELAIAYQDCFDTSVTCFSWDWGAWMIPLGMGRASCPCTYPPTTSTYSWLASLPMLFSISASSNNMDRSVKGVSMLSQSELDEECPGLEAPEFVL